MRIKNIECSVSRIRADEIETVVLKHFTAVATGDKYFDEIEKVLKQKVEVSFSASENHLPALKKELKSIELGIASTFRFQASGAIGAGGLALIAEQLEKLGQRKKDLQIAIQAFDSANERSGEIPAAVNELRELVGEFKRGYSNASPAMKRRLLRKILKGLVLRTDGLEVSFHVEERVSIQSSAESNVVDLKAADYSRRGKVSDLSLLSAKLPIVENGWGGRGRTCE